MIEARVPETQQALVYAWDFDNLQKCYALISFSTTFSKSKKKLVNIGLWKLSLVVTVKQSLGE
jgi:hypothetical protein